MNYEQTQAVSSVVQVEVNVNMSVPKLDITVNGSEYLRTKRRNEKAAELKAAQAASERFALEMEIANDPEDAEYRIKDKIWSKKIGLEFVKHYPGHGWEVHVDIRQGIVNVFNRHMSARHGYRIKIKDIHLSSLSQHIKKVGGEILERFRLSREKFDSDLVRQIQFDTRGDHKADLS